MKTKKFFLSIFLSNLKHMFYETIHNHKMKTYVRDEVFFEKDFDRKFTFSHKMNSTITKDEIIPLYIEYFQRKLIKYNEKGYMPFAQRIINTHRYINWLEKQLPLEEREINNSRLKVICNTSVFAHLLNELIYRDYIEGYKIKDNEINMNATARIIKKSFLILQTDGKTEVSDVHLANEMRNCSLTDENKKALRLPSNK